MTDEERVERVLRGLTGVSAAEGLEDRVLRRLAERRVETRAGWRWMVPVLALGACAVMALVVGMRHRAVSPVVVAPTVAMAVEPLRESQGVVVPAASKARVSVRVARRTEVVSFPAPVAPLTEQERLLVRLVHAREAEQFEAVAAIREPKEADVALTHEEKLLVAVSRVRQDVVMEALDPVRRAEAEARQKREFDAYVQQKDGGS